MKASIMQMLEEPNCSKRRCVHYIGIKEFGTGEEDQRNVCLAFPSGIPYQIAYGEDKHRLPFKRQKNAFVFQAKRRRS